MPLVYATQPFTLISTPAYAGRADGNVDEYDRMASTMAVVHNALIRSLNSIYLQASSANAKTNPVAFLQYSRMWYTVVHLHHSHEEAKLFPEVEKICGEAGIMTVNVEQHHMFEAGLKSYAAYLDECLQDPGRFQPATLRGIIDGFAKDLSTHLADEIEQLRQLRRFGEPAGVKIHKTLNDGGEEQLKTAGLFGAVPFVLAAHDLDFEEGMWKDFPPAPAPLLWVIRRILWHAHRDWWVFAPCDSSGHMRELNTD